jgi:hypothetical protein
MGLPYQDGDQDFDIGPQFTLGHNHNRSPFSSVQFGSILFLFFEPKPRTISCFQSNERSLCLLFSPVSPNSRAVK